MWPATPVAHTLSQMSDDRGPVGPVKIPDALFEATDEDAQRERRQEEVLAALEARVRAGQMTIREADEELMRLALEDFDYLSERTRAHIRSYAGALLERCPELVESRPRVAEHYGAETGDDDEEEPR